MLSSSMTRPYGSNYNSNGCDEWPGRRNAQGYGKSGGGRLTHRVAWEKAHGPIPAGMDVLHTCDNPPCRALGHLFLGTQRDNYADMVAKGRQVVLRGEDCGTARLTETDVLAIRSQYRADRFGYKRLAKRYGVDRTTIRAILRRKTWAHVK